MLNLMLLECALLLPMGTAGEDTVDFSRDVRPILDAHCVDCHGSQTQEAGLRMDVGAGLLRGGDSGAAVSPRKSNESLLIQVVLGTHRDVSQMPLDADPLSAKQIETLRRWIDAGAPLPDHEKNLKVESDHWSFQPVTRPVVPTVSHNEWPRTAIDRFLLARLESERIAPSAQADPVTLLRRLHLDLIGLPPTPEEVERFLADAQPGAYERCVDRLLATPHFGERWGRHWLDAARYADSHGYTIDGPRSIWKYRDWVIDALNRDLPFDQFVIEQLAGDLLPNATLDQLVATGFHRNTMFNQEGGTDPEQFRVERVVDRVNTTGEVFLALTLGCAQCHSHKYDPISQREYFQIFAFFNSSEEPELPTPSPEQQREQQRLRAALKVRTHELAAEQSEWSRRLSQMTTAWQVGKPAAFASESGAAHQVLDDGSIVVGGENAAHDVYTFTTEELPASQTGFRLEALTDDSLPKQGPGRAANGNFVLAELSVTFTPTGGTESQPAAIAHAVADHEQPGFPVVHVLDGDLKTGWAINTNGTGPMNVNRTALFTFKEPSTAAGVYTITFRHSTNNNGYNIGRFRLSFTSEPGPLQLIPEDVQTILAVDADKRTQEQARRLTEFQRNADPETARLTRALNALKSQIPTTMVVRETAQPRETYVHLRGDFLSKGDRVQPNVPAVLGGSPEAAFANRLEFARWLVSGDNPLTSRVMVNRVWQHLFGVGIVETENDFGTQGTPPTHPELLDWLASEFVSQGWSVKDLIRLIVTSAAYRQSSHDRPDLASIDPTNRLLARQRRVRVEAEIIRDITLSVSGLLCDRVGGPSVFPYQPDGVMDLPQVKREWKISSGGDQYRRGMYTFLWRTSPHPYLKMFDAPESLTTCTRRDRSNTPLQALVLLNDEGFVECARELARRLLKEDGLSDEQRIERAFVLCVSRKPSADEKQVLLHFLEDQRATLKEQNVAPPGELEREAWTTIARAMMNLDELITRE